ncbi:OsmC family protein [Olivibacter sp. SDN3]|uniref:OsmC family protein n=1 Tax=Olivibacter sp. SDN3 TaxID=2764720 RepID=UPI0016512F10|nr:OsmC family protein [Olivibacter sp. SDN3]QNL49968.1 OsmC family protein [Olivibacter sp. SDN3]
MKKTHSYQLTNQWTGNTGVGTKDYRSFDRSYLINIENKPVIEGSSDPAFRGDRTKYNPEELLLASLSSCHMLWYLHLCAEAKIIVESYQDHASGLMIETANGSGYFSEVTLKPQVAVVEETMISKALELHKQANKLCFIANSVNFPVHHTPSCSAIK